MPCKSRSSDRLHGLVCDIIHHDGVVWLHLLKQTTDFSKETLEELVDFVLQNIAPVLNSRTRALPLRHGDGHSALVQVGMHA